MSSEKSSIERIIDQINSKNAKKIAVLLVLGFACYHGILHIKYGNAKFFHSIQTFIKDIFQEQILVNGYYLMVDIKGIRNGSLMGVCFICIVKCETFEDFHVIK